MADIFQQELESFEGQETTNDNTQADENLKSKCEENTNIKDKENGDLNNEIDNYFENFICVDTHPLPTLEELANSDYIHNRQLAAKKILDSLQRAGSDQEEYQSIISVMCKLSEDEESMVRSELVQHIPSIALYCRNQSCLKLVVSQQLVPYTVKLLNDSHLSVRKLAQTALLVLLENNLIGQLQLSDWICPLVAQLAACASNLDEQRIEDVTVMSMMIPLVDSNLTLKFFLDPFISLCSDRALGVRTVCAMRFGTLCKTAGTEITESALVPTFLELCNDLAWGVRKACANVFVDVTNVVSLKTRKDILSKALLDLLDDSSNHVRLAAYQSLGGFICSFADPSKTGFVCENGKLNFLKTEENIKQKFAGDINKSAGLKIDVNQVNCRSNTSPEHIHSTATSVNSQLSNEHSKMSEGHKLPELNQNSHSCFSVKDDRIFHPAAGENSYNNFQFWRVPLPEVDIDCDVLEESDVQQNKRCRLVASTEQEPQTLPLLSSINVSELNSNVENRKLCTNNISLHNERRSVVYDHVLVWDSTVLAFKSEEVIDGKEADNLNISETEKVWFPKRRELSLDSISTHELLDNQDELLDNQDIVPYEILRKYFDALMIKPNATVDSDELNAACAFSFPAVTYTLGRKYWPCLRAIFRRVTRNVQSFSEWRNRCAIASSLPQLACMLGQDIIMEDLLPKFLEFLVDIDEVRQSVVMQIPDFLRHVPPEERCQFFVHIEDFLEDADNMKWRFRCCVAEQLSATLKLCNPHSIHKYFLPIALNLLQDKVFAVRFAAAEFVASIVKYLLDDAKLSLLSKLDTQYRQAHKWNQRQTYVLVCEQLAKKKSLCIGMFVEEVVPRLFSLAWDVVPNVRLAVSRCIALSLLPQDYLPSIQKTNYDLLLQVMYSLQSDIDEDVRHFGLLSARAFSVLPEKKLSPV